VELRRYFTTFYYTEVSALPGQRAADYLHPEWANLRFFSGDFPDARSPNGTSVSGSPFPATGPSSQAAHFSLGTSRMWGVGLLPLGWAKFVRVPASEVADVVADGMTHPAFAPFVPLARSVFGPEPDEEGELGRITDWFRERAGQSVTDEDRIVSIHKALVDPYVATVGELVERVGASQRTIERLCGRAFGFSPKLLLRRQRFMRSLSQYMLDPSLRWIGAIDSTYHDQAQFVREFNQFMGMAPGAYAAMDHPIVGAVMRERVSFSWAPVQTLDPPDGTQR
jgi:AraC-like DNA-binding protein